MLRAGILMLTVGYRMAVSIVMKTENSKNHSRTGLIVRTVLVLWRPATSANRKSLSVKRCSLEMRPC